MLKLFVLACCLVAVSQGEAEAEAQFGFPYYSGGYPYHAPQQHPQTPAVPANLAGSLGHNNEASQRILWGQLFNLMYKKSTIFVTSSFVFTCSQSTTACAGRRRRAVLSDLLENEQFEEITPSQVHAIEPTATAESVREEREADPQFFYPSPYAYLPQAYGAELEGSHQQGTTGYLPEALDISRQSLPSIPSFPGSSLLFSGRTVYFTSVVIVISTSTYLPSCSVKGTMAQCPVLG